MIEVETKKLRDMNGGNYKPSLLGKLKSLLYQTTPHFGNYILGLDTVVLDISFYQRFANFQTMKDYGVSGVIVRAGQNLWEDSCANTYMTDAKAKSFPTGSYWFYDSRVSPQDQAKKWKEVVKDFPLQLRCWADYEETYGGPFGGWKYFYDFLEACKKEMPDRKFGIYTGYYYWVEHSPNPVTQASSLEYFKQYPLWLAWYVSDILLVKIPKPWTSMVFWQKTAKGDGTASGVGSLNVDVDVFVGTPQEFKETFGIENGGSVEMPETTYTGTVKANTTAVVRATAGGTDTGQRLTSGTEVLVTGAFQNASLNGVTYTWANVFSPVSGWVATSLLDLKPATPTTTPHILEVYLDGVLEYRKEF